MVSGKNVLFIVRFLQTRAFYKLGKFLYVFQLNTGQTGGPVGVDTNVLPVWKSGITGRGVVVAVLDDGKTPYPVLIKYLNS